MNALFSRQAFSVLNYLVMTLCGIVMLLPFLHIVAGSFSSGHALITGQVTVLPVEFNLENYKAVLNNRPIWNAFGVTAVVTVLGTLLNLVFTLLMAYGLSKPDLRGRKAIMLLILFTMIFQAPLIPSYLLVKYLGMLNTIWALMIPGLISAFNLIIMISFFRSFPEGLVESAKMDGCGEYRTLWRIVLPLSLPSLTTIGLFYAVSHWNSYTAALIYVRNPKLQPLQIVLRRLIVESDAEQMMRSAVVTIQSLEGIKAASIIVATVPILVIYPLIQKHFVKGAMLGSVKG
ncbi:carbohydrate ABC transporter permease [Paenibacillus aurantius]|uniref:Carbohydrate ABC transporter permease n=1 Tax=Paenibacillus aurantius TaxID=2918900 RepID=A0AA96LAI5_9BACL|nr:carbohydrate ABC transporter permease [Paenibacillus aurantius]WNQ09559.1 carbohydrate ABC transporter permease [Paenibacillus aurantius]